MRKISWLDAELLHPSWKHSYSVRGHYTLLEMLDVFILYVAAE
jgi:hypothetical protein